MHDNKLPPGRNFLLYAKRAVSQYELIEYRYIAKDRDKKHFSVSMQHNIFAVHAFVNTVKAFSSFELITLIGEVYIEKRDEVIYNAPSFV